MSTVNKSNFMAANTKSQMIINEIVYIHHILTLIGLQSLFSHMENSKLMHIAFAFMMLVSFQTLLTANEDLSYKEIHVGVILDLGSSVGKLINRCVTKGISDFYTANPHYRTRIVLDTRDTEGEPLLALSAARGLLENNEVQAILGPHSTSESRILELMEGKTNIPTLSFSTSPFTNQNPYFLRIAPDETNEFKGIVAMVESFKQKNIILICEDAANGRETATYIISSFQDQNIDVTYTSLISTSSSNKQILEEFHKFQAMQTVVFLMHSPPSLSSKLFLMAKELGMMSEGYMWIITSKTANFLKFMDSKGIELMQGVVGFKSYLPKSQKYHKLKSFMGLKEVHYNGILAYDAVYALAMAVERVQTEKHVRKLALLNHISRISFHGIGGEFKFMNARTISKAIEVVNVIGKGAKRVGFWMVNDGFVKKIGNTNSSLNNGLDIIILPGVTTRIQNHRRLQMNGKKMRILVPVFGGFPNLLHMSVDPRTNLPNVSGYCGDVFYTAFNALNYKVDIEFFPYPFKPGRTFNDLIDKVYHKEFDAAIGDITITSNRSRYVDFTLPFSDMGVGTLARNANYRSMWIFFDPFSANLWFTSASFFLILGLVVWFIEHRTNKEFQGSTRQQIGTTLWFAYSTLVYAHREKLESNLSRFVVTIWVFVVLVLTSSYTATLSSFLTVQQIASKGGSLQFQGIMSVGSDVFNLKRNNGQRLKLHSPEDYTKALSSGSVVTVVNEILYIKSVLALYSGPEFSVVATASTTNGFGFVFQKGSPLAKDMSTQIAKLREDGTLKALEDKWLQRQPSMIPKGDPAMSPHILNLYGLRGLFLVSGVSMALALLMSLVYLAHEKCQSSKMELLRCIFRRFFR